MKKALLIKSLREIGVSVYYGHVIKADVKEALSRLWDQSGEYYKKYEMLWDKLVPEQGSADTSEGELLRSISRIYYDYYNNGWGNEWQEELDTIISMSNAFKKHLEDANSLKNFLNIAEDYASGDWAIEDYMEDEEDEMDDTVWLPDPMKGPLSQRIEKSMEDVANAIIKYVWEEKGTLKVVK